MSHETFHDGNKPVAPSAMAGHYTAEKGYTDYPTYSEQESVVA